MSMEQAATFLAASVLMSLGLLVIVSAAVAINYILQKYWKPVKIFTPDSWTGFHPPESKIEPKFINK